ncbi:hypothetical protein BRADI_3g22733v3 [Brachypodium distachyon]|uniref:Uncharacterized protein n=1 Tax=Brachypodium distachyon TaxID=15368 RepID=A0A2K2CYW0_BRADI|nr:hypothetical protein BRADI_3g22733v3 [Brachypodium distachyon]
MLGHGTARSTRRRMRLPVVCFAVCSTPDLRRRGLAAERRSSPASCNTGGRRFQHNRTPVPASSPLLCSTNGLASQHRRLPLCSTGLTSPPPPLPAPAAITRSSAASPYSTGGLARGSTASP